ncbi:MAG: NIL domain-containing protein [Syntrophomonadaceae bacterium]|nr:NIL domain-containing protein [Syntrophomonadaceae bacterium]MDD3889505.1 NIL domain-containing protein [Syntrophomonadaceae bacterium]MDD4548668.1 NIL domain-containing protein [Syntrophomonadaceae bacterium]
MKNKVVLYFSAAQSEQPIIYRLVKNYDLVVNILKADINPQKQGYLVVEMEGEKDKYQEGISFLKGLGVIVESLSETVVWQEDVCIQCGACASFCPTEALEINRETMEISFNNSKCVVCGMCLDCCPTRAITLHFDIRGLV